MWRTLLALGATEVEAKETLIEVYSPPRVTKVASRCPKYRILPGGAYDLRPGPDGVSWDFTRRDHREEVRRRVARAKPYILIGSPPCTDWRAFNVRVNHPRMDPAVVA